MMIPSASRASARKSWCHGTRDYTGTTAHETLYDAVLGADVDQDDPQLTVAMRGTRCRRYPREHLRTHVDRRCGPLRLSQFQTAGIEPPLHGAALTQPLSQGASVDATEDRQAFVCEPGLERVTGEVMTEVPRQLLRNQALHLDPRRLKAGSAGSGRHAVIAYERIREDQDLAGIRRVSQRLDVAGHAGVEDDFARYIGLRPITLAPEQGAVLECKGHGLRHRGRRSRHERQSRSNFVS